MIEKFKSYCMKLEALPHDALVRSAEKLVLAENTNIAKLIAHLAEMSARKTALELGYKSLYQYCIKHLNLSEGAVPARIQDGVDVDADGALGGRSAFPGGLGRFRMDGSKTGFGLNVTTYSSVFVFGVLEYGLQNSRGVEGPADERWIGCQKQQSVEKPLRFHGFGADERDGDMVAKRPFRLFQKGKRRDDRLKARLEHGARGGAEGLLRHTGGLRAAGPAVGGFGQTARFDIVHLVNEAGHLFQTSIEGSR